MLSRYGVGWAMIRAPDAEQLRGNVLPEPIAEIQVETIPSSPKVWVRQVHRVCDAAGGAKSGRYDEAAVATQSRTSNGAQRNRNATRNWVVPPCWNGRISGSPEAVHLPAVLREGAEKCA